MTARAERYAAAAQTLLRESGCTVRRWRSGSSGSAYIGTPDWAIECPRPTGPVSFAILAHEVGHHLLHGDKKRRPRWVEEVEAWEYALAQFRRFGLSGSVQLERHAAISIGYAFVKAIRRSPLLASTIFERYPEWWLAAEREDARGLFEPAMSRERKALDE